MIAQHRRGEQDWSMQIWQFLTLELWMQAFLDRPAPQFNDLAMQVATA
jgi:asparagine synthase (glutamine-hydrolysing)